MNKYKDLFSNTAIFALSSLASKFITFILLPFYTGVLTTSEYSMIEMFTTTLSFFMPILTLSIAEAALRFMLTKTHTLEKIFSAALVIECIGTMILLLGYPIVEVYFIEIKEYYGLFIILFLVNTLNQLFFKCAKALDKVRECGIASIMNTIITALLNVYFLKALDWGITGYLSAFIIGQAYSLIYLMIKVKLYQLVDIKSIDKVVIKQMLGYSVPFIPSAIAWWVNTASDRYIVTLVCGLAVNGLYSAANKIPSIISVVTSIFQQAWQLSGIREYGKKDYDTFYAQIYNTYDRSITLMSSIIIACSPMIAKLLFSGEFFSAWIYIPFLIIGTMFSSLSGLLGTAFQAANKTAIMVISTLAGAVLNMVLNIVLVYKYGALGAASATAISFGVVWGVRLYNSRTIVQIEIPFGKVFLNYCIIMIQSICIFTSIQTYLIINGICVIGMVLLNMKEAMSHIKEILARLKAH